MPGGRRPIRPRAGQQRPQTNPYGAPRGQQGYGEDATYKMIGGQLTVGNKSGARSWLPSAELAADNPLNTFGGKGVLAPMGMGDNGFMQFGYVPGARNEGEAGYNMGPTGRGAGYAMEGMNRAGTATNQGWDPQGRANTQAWRGMQAALGGGQAQVQRPLGPRQQGRPQNSPGGMPNQGPQLRPSHPGDARFQGGASPAGGAPHNEIGQRGRGAGRVRPGGGNRPGGGLPGTPPGGMPDFNQGPPPNFLPNTPGWELARQQASGQLLGAETGYNAQNAMIPAQLALQQARLTTDEELARNSLDENLAGRGLITSGLRGKAQAEQVATPYGRRFQDLGLGAAGSYADASSQWGGANMGYQQDILNALMQRANDVYAAQPYGMSVGQYSAPDMPTFQPYYQPGRQGGGRQGGGRRRPGRGRQGRGGNK